MAMPAHVLLSMLAPVSACRTLGGMGRVGYGGAAGD
jgi:hypothetical protein